MSRRTLIVLMCCIVGIANAADRSADDEPLAEIDNWLRALKGQFRLSVQRHEMAGQPVVQGMALDGIVDCADSTAEAGASTLRNDALILQVQCPVIQSFPPSNRGGSITVLSCRREIRIHVRADGRSVRVRQSTFEQILVRQPFAPSQIVEFPTQLEWALERVQAELSPEIR